VPEAVRSSARYLDSIQAPRSKGFSQPPDNTAVFSFSEAGIIAALIALATYLRIHQVGVRSLWGDEAFSALMAKLPWRDFFRLVRDREVNMTLYYVLLRAWTAFGNSPAWLRGLSVAAGVATIPVLYALARRLFGIRTAAVAALLLSVNAYHIRYAQEVRSYALTVLFVCLSFLFFVRCVQRASGWDWIAYGIISALAMYSHLLAGLVVLPQLCSLLWWPQAWSARAEIWRGLRLIAYLCVPLGILAIEIGPAPVASMARTDSHMFAEFLRSFCGNDGWALVAVSLIGIAASVLVTRHRVQVGLVIAWLLLPMLVVIAISLLRPIFSGKYLLFCLPALSLALACAVVRLPRWIGFLLVVLLTTLSIRGTLRYYVVDFDLTREDWQSASKYIASNVTSTDTLFFYPGVGVLPYEYYGGPRDNKPAIAYPPLPRDQAYGAFPPMPLAEVFDKRPNRNSRIWLVLSDSAIPSSAADFVRHWCRDQHHLASQQRFEHLLVEVYDAGAPQ